MRESILLIFIFTSVATAMLEMYFQHIQGEGQILEPYRKFWLHIVRYKRLLSRYDKKYPLVYFMAYISKPMSLCCYCNGTWLSIIVGTILLGLSMNVFLFIGTTWFFIRILDKYNIV